MIKVMHKTNLVPYQLHRSNLKYFNTLVFITPKWLATTSLWFWCRSKQKYTLELYSLPFILLGLLLKADERRVSLVVLAPHALYIGPSTFYMCCLLISFPCIFMESIFSCIYNFFFLHSSSFCHGCIFICFAPFALYPVPILRLDCNVVWTRKMDACAIAMETERTNGRALLLNWEETIAWLSIFMAIKRERRNWNYNALFSYWV